MVSTDRIPVREMRTWHQNGPFPVDLLYRARQRGEEGFDLHNESVLEIQKILDECQTEGKRFRAFGSLWSLNDIAFNGSRVHNNTAMDMCLLLTAANIHPDKNISHENLAFIQCGATMRQVSRFLESHKKSVKVSGGSNGQTIAGVISTGVHGGAIDHQCISDYVKGLHLVIGPKSEDRVYLERASERILNDDFAQMLNSRLIQDDDIFNAAIVGLGSFGFIAGVVLETEDIYSLRRYIKKIDYDDAIELVETLDFDSSNFKIHSEVDGNGVQIRPYHFKPYINQYTKKCIAEVIYKVPFKKTELPEFEIEKQLHPDVFRLMHWALEKSEGDIVKLLSKLLQGTAFPNPKRQPKPITATIGDIFHYVDYIQPGFSWAFCVDNSQIARAMNTFIEVFKNNRAPGLTAIRLVRQTKATIGQIKFPITAIIGMDGVQWTPQGNLLPREVIQNELIKAFIRDNIEFTVHWGKNAAWDFPGLVDTMYGDRDDEWVKQRSRLLRFEMAAMFSNDFLQRVGLGGYNRNVPIIA